MVKRGKVVVDLGRNAATVTGDDGTWEGTWSGVTRRTTETAIGRDGWKLAAPFETSPADNGAVAPVVKEES